MHTYAPTTIQRTSQPSARWSPLLIVAGSVATAVVLINLTLVYLVEPPISHQTSARPPDHRMAPGQVAPQEPASALQIAGADTR